MLPELCLSAVISVIYVFFLSVQGVLDSVFLVFSLVLHLLQVWCTCMCLRRCARLSCTFKHLCVYVCVELLYAALEHLFIGMSLPDNVCI